MSNRRSRSPLTQLSPLVTGSRRSCSPSPGSNQDIATRPSRTKKLPVPADCSPSSVRLRCTEGSKSSLLDDMLTPAACGEFEKGPSSIQHEVSTEDTTGYSGFECSPGLHLQQLMTPNTPEGQIIMEESASPSVSRVAKKLSFSHVSPKRKWYNRFVSGAAQHENLPSKDVEVIQTSGSHLINRGVFWLRDDRSKNLSASKNTWKIFLVAVGKAPVCVLLQDEICLDFGALARAASQMFIKMNYTEVSFKVC